MEANKKSKGPVSIVVKISSMQIHKCGQLAINYFGLGHVLVSIVNYINFAL